MMSSTTAVKHLPEDIERDFAGATSALLQKASEIRSQKIQWPSYLQSNMISDEEFKVIVAVEMPGKHRDDINAHPNNQFLVAKTFVNLLSHISKDQTIQYILIIIDDILCEDKSRVNMFQEYSKRQKESVWGAFLNLLTRPDLFIMNMTSRIIAKLACWMSGGIGGSDLNFYFTWLKDQLRTPSEYVGSVARCLQMLLREDRYRTTFVELGGLDTLVQALDTGKLNFQIQYQLTFCLWVITFKQEVAESVNKLGIVPILADVLNESVKEKVTRIVLAVFRNLIEKPQEPSVARENCIQMVSCKVLKQLEILSQRKFDDEDITADIVYLNEKLLSSIQDLSSFEEYCSEVKSGRMRWSPVHKSEKFWRENCHRLNEKNYELLRILINLLETSQDALVLSVACHDIGEYTRHYVRGKKVLEQLGGKQLVMNHLTHDDQNVRYAALLAVQKLMVHNWEYLGKQLEKKTQSEDAPNTITARG